MQEDYFIDDTVDVAMLDRLVALMEREPISQVSLMPDGRPGTSSGHEFLSTIDRRAEYRISAQAGLWRKSALRSYLRRHETVWEFEWYGTRRARRRRDSFLYVNREYEELHGKRVVPYVGTGVLQGRWNPEVESCLPRTASSSTSRRAASTIRLMLFRIGNRVRSGRSGGFARSSDDLARVLRKRPFERYLQAFARLLPRHLVPSLEVQPQTRRPGAYLAISESVRYANTCRGGRDHGSGVR